MTRFETVQRVVWRWWADLQENHNRGGRAQIRRAVSAEDLLLVPQVQRLYRELDLRGGLPTGSLESSFAQVAATATVVATVTVAVAADPPADDAPIPGRPLAELLGPPPGESDSTHALLKPLRFRRLLQADDSDPMILARDLRRAVRLLKPGAGLDVGTLGASLLAWGPKIRTRWAFDYYRGGEFSTSPEPHEMERP